MDGVTAMQKGQRQWSHASSEWEMAARGMTQGGGNVTKGDVTTSHQSEREAEGAGGQEAARQLQGKARGPSFWGR